MSAPKKTTSKSTKSPAPATKSVAPKAVTKKKAAPVAAAKTPAPAPAPAPVVAVAPSPAPVAAPKLKPTVTKPVATTIAARVDVGFGNALFIRGEGPGLSWDTGVVMECVGPDLWRIVLGESARAYAFKFLVNDLSWSTGPDFSAASGSSVTFTPEF